MATTHNTWNRDDTGDLYLQDRGSNFPTLNGELKADGSVKTGKQFVSKTAVTSIPSTSTAVTLTVAQLLQGFTVVEATDANAITISLPDAHDIAVALKDCEVGDTFRHTVALLDHTATFDVTINGSNDGSTQTQYALVLAADGKLDLVLRVDEFDRTAGTATIVVY
jgi:hypothetical protein